MTSKNSDPKAATMNTSDATHRARGGRGRFVKSIETAERDADACRLRTEGQTYAQIAETLGYNDKAAAQKAVERALTAIVAEPASHLRALEDARLDVALVVAFRVLRTKHITVSNGRLILDPVTELPLQDDAPNLAAIDRIVKISDRRAKLHGLDAPVKFEGFDPTGVDAQIAQLAADLGMNDPQSAR